MTHKPPQGTYLGNHHWLFAVELIPETNLEKSAIKNAASATMSEEEREVLDNYLLWCLGSTYSFVNLESQKGNIFVIKAFQN